MDSAIMLVKTKLGTEKEVAKELKSIACVTGVYEVYGVYDIVAKIEASSREDLKQICSEKIRNMKSITSTLTLVVV
tara:strand:- start:693 stop:920 length:228 start_codon:yes stop_codon:yes gene_type:complete